MYENTRCKRWLTTNQDEYQNPLTKKVENYIQSEEFGRYEDCMAIKDCQEQTERTGARPVICCAEQNANREPVSFSTDSHIDPELRATKPPWCRCLATGNPSLYEENREEHKTDDMCYCKMCYGQTDVPSVDNPRAKIYSSTNFIDFRDPAYPFIENKLALQKVLDDKFKAYKAKVDAEDAAKERKLAPLPPGQQDPLEPNCIGNYDSLPPPKRGNEAWQEDQSWFREDTDDCTKKLLKKYVWTTTYREMNKDGAALPLVVREMPTTCRESPPGDPVRPKPDMAPCTIVHLGDVFEKWDRPQVRRMARRCDTISNNPFLDSCCLEKDSYFQEQFLDRTKYAECPPKVHDTPSEENMRLAKENKLRQVYDRMIPGYAGYDPVEAPPVCKIKKVFNPFDPYDPLSMYQADFGMHPEDNYAHPVEPYKPAILEQKGIATNPINALSKRQLPDATRLSCYLECKQVPCQKCPDGRMSSYIECQRLPCKTPPRIFGQPPQPSEYEPIRPVQVVIPAQLKTDSPDATYAMDVPKEYQECRAKPKEDLMQIGTYVVNPDHMKVTAKSTNLMLGKKKEYRGCH